MQPNYQAFPQGMYQQPAYPTRLPQMQPMYQQQQAMMQPMQAAPMPQTVMTLVTSKEQAMVAQIPFDGQTYYFANTANNEVYAKRFDATTGQSPLVTYKREPDDPAAEYATIGMVQALAQHIQALQEQLQAAAKGKRTVKQTEEDEAQ